MIRISEIRPECVGIRKALRRAFRAPANDVPSEWEQLLERMV